MSKVKLADAKTQPLVRICLLSAAVAQWLVPQFHNPEAAGSSVLCWTGHQV